MGLFTRLIKLITRNTDEAANLAARNADEAPIDTLPRYADIMRLEKAIVAQHERALQSAQKALSLFKNKLHAKVEAEIAADLDWALMRNPQRARVTQANERVYELTRQGADPDAIESARKIRNAEQEALEESERVLKENFEIEKAAKIEQGIKESNLPEIVAENEERLAAAQKRLDSQKLSTRAKALSGALYLQDNEATQSITANDILWAGIETLDTLTTGPIEYHLLGKPSTEKLDKVFGELEHEIQKPVYTDPRSWMGY